MFHLKLNSKIIEKSVSGFFIAILVLSTFACLMSFTPMAKASGALIDSCTSSTSNFDGIGDVYPDGTLWQSCIRGQSFKNTGTTDHIGSCTFDLKKVSSPTGYLCAILFACNGTYGGDDDVPVTTPLAYSEYIAASTLTTSFVTYTFTFNSTNQYELTTNTAYCIGLAALNQTINASNYVAMRSDTNTSLHAGNGFGMEHQTYWESVACDYAFAVYGASGDDTTKPTYSTMGRNNTGAGNATLFYCQINDDNALHPNGQYQFGTNNTGEWVWESAVNFTATPNWANVTKTLNSTVGNVIGYCWNFTDNAGNSNTTGTHTLTVSADPTIPEVPEGMLTKIVGEDDSSAIYRWMNSTYRWGNKITMPNDNGTVIQGHVGITAGSICTLKLAIYTNNDSKAGTLIYNGSVTCAAEAGVYNVTLANIANASAYCTLNASTIYYLIAEINVNDRFPVNTIYDYYVENYLVSAGTFDAFPEVSSILGSPNQHDTYQLYLTYFTTNKLITSYLPSAHENVIPMITNGSRYLGIFASNGYGAAPNLESERESLGIYEIVSNKSVYLLETTGTACVGESFSGINQDWQQLYTENKYKVFEVSMFTEDRNNPSNATNVEWAICQGEFDYWLDDLISQCKTYEHPMIIKINPEMNANWYYFGTDTDAFKSSWMYIVSYFANNSVTNVDWCLSYTWQGNLGFDFADYYAGADYVQRIGVDIYCMDDEDYTRLPSQISTFLDWAVPIADESNVAIDLTEFAVYEYWASNGHITDQNRANWLTAMFNIVEATPQIQLIRYSYAYQSATSSWLFQNYNATDTVTYAPLTSAVYRDRIANASYLTGGTIIEEYSVNVTISATISILIYGAGTIAPLNGTYTYNVTNIITLNATAATHYIFMGWLENGVLISGSNTSSYNYTVTGDTILTAIFYDPTLKESYSPLATIGIALGISATIGLAATLGYILKRNKKRLGLG